MRKTIYRMPEPEAWAMLRSAHAVHLSATDSDGNPVFRTLHAVVDEGTIYFHGAPAGEKLLAIGRPAVVAVEEVAATIPSYFLDAERACPATTYYRSVQAHGTLRRVEEPARKAAVLGALMARYQPEGGHVPLSADHPLYRAAVEGILVLQIPVERLDGKAKLGQNRRPSELAIVIERLWERGRPGDVRAIELLRSANPAIATPSFLIAPPGASLVCTMGPDDLAAVVDLLAGEYWNRGLDRETIAAAHRGATAWVGARDEDGRPIASARAISDGAKYAWIYDVVVAPHWRGKGLGTAVVRLLRDHPLVRGARNVHLSTRDAQPVYARLGFVERAALPPRPWPSTEMVFCRARSE